MTYEQIEKEFDENFAWAIEKKADEEIIDGYKGIKSFLKQSFIKYLQSEVERLEKELKSFKNGSVCYPSEPVKYTEGITDTLEKQITHITNQIRELEG